MRIQNINMIQRHLITTRRQGMSGAVAIFVVPGILLAALVTAI